MLHQAQKLTHYGVRNDGRRERVLQGRDDMEYREEFWDVVLLEVGRMAQTVSRSRRAEEILRVLAIKFLEAAGSTNITAKSVSRTDLLGQLLRIDRKYSKQALHELLHRLEGLDLVVLDGNLVRASDSLISRLWEVWRDHS